MSVAWETRFASYVQRLLGVKESTQLTALPDLMPVLPVVDPAQHELALLRGEKICTALFSSPAVVGRRSAVRFVLGSAIPLPTDYLAAIDEIHVGSSGGAAASAVLEATWDTAGIAGEAAFVSYFTDRRQAVTFPGISAPRAIVSECDIDGAGATTPFAMLLMPAAASGGVTWRPNIVLGGSSTATQFFLTNTVLNAGICGYIRWRERTIAGNPGEAKGA